MLDNQIDTVLVFGYQLSLHGVVLDQPGALHWPNPASSNGYPVSSIQFPASSIQYRPSLFTASYPANRYTQLATRYLPLSRIKSISDPRHCMNIYRIIDFCFDLFSESLNVDINRTAALIQL